MVPFFIGLAVYEGIGLAVRHYRFPREPVYMSLAWPLVLGMGGK